MNKKILILVLLSSLFYSCSNQMGPTTDQDYAGAWEMFPGRYAGTDITILTDTTYESYVQYPSIGLFKSHKGFVRADPENGTMYIVTTHVFDYSDPVIEYVEVLSKDYFMPLNTEGQYMPVEEIDSFGDNPIYQSYLTDLVTRDNYDYSVSGGIFYFDGGALSPSNFTE